MELFRFVRRVLNLTSGAFRFVVAMGTNERLRQVTFVTRQKFERKLVALKMLPFSHPLLC